MNITKINASGNLAKPLTKEQNTQIERAYEQLEDHKWGDAIGHILAHRSELSVNTDPRYANTWRTKDGETLYAVETWEFDDKCLAEKVRGSGPKELEVKSKLVETPKRRINYHLDEDLVDAQINVVCDMYREMPEIRRRWLLNYITKEAESYLHRVAAVMLACDFPRENGIQILALCHGDIFASELVNAPTLKVSGTDPISRSKQPNITILSADETDIDAEEVEEITRCTKDTKSNDLSFISSQQNFKVRVALAKNAFAAVPDPDDKDEPGDLKFHSIADFISRPTPEFLVQGMLPKKGVAIIYGASGSMKSFACAHLGLSIAGGHDIGDLKVEATPVLFLLNEGQAGFGRRLQSALKYHDWSPPDNFRIADEAPNLMSANSIKPFIDLAKRMQFNPGLIVLDTFSKATIGADDNSTKEMAEAIAVAYALSNSLDCLVILIDHTGKDQSKGVRGSYAKHANVDAVLMVSKTSENVCLALKKQKEAEDGIKYNFRINMVEIEGEKVPALSFRTDQVEFSQKELILMQVSSGEHTRETLYESFAAYFGSAKKKSFNVVYQRLIKECIIEEKDGIVVRVEEK